MFTLRHVCLWAGVLSLCTAMATDTPITGTWEGSLEGKRAVTLRLSATEGRLGGEAVFYILKDNGNGSHNGDASEPTRLVGTEWDGQTLRFSVVNPAGETVRFTMKRTGQSTGVLTSLRPDGTSARDMLMKRLGN